MADNGEVIDKLSIEIGSDIANASKGIGKLQSTLNKLKGIYDNLGGASNNVSEKLKDLASGMTAISKINSESVNGVTDAMKKFSKIDFGRLASIPTGVAENLSSLASGVNLFSMAVDGDSITEALKPLKKLAAFDFGALSDNISRLDPSAASKVREFMSAFEGISGDFALTDSLESMRALFSMDFSGFNAFMASAADGLPGLASGIQKFADACGTPEFEAAIDRLSRLANVDLSGLSQLAQSGHFVAPDISGAVDKETEKVKASTDKMKSTLSSGFVKAMSGLKFVGTLPFKGIGLGIKAIGNAADKAKAKISKFVLSFGRIAFYRSIRFLFSQITKGFKEGADNLYQYSKAINGQFAKSIDTISTALLYFRNSVAAASAPIINSIAPAFDLMVDKIVEMLNVFNEFTAKLTGASTWTKALKYPKEYAESTNKASKALKDFQMGFDELNVISDTSAENGVDAIDYSKMFVEMPVTDDFAPWLDEFRSSLENTDFYTAGAILADKFNHLFDDVDYEEIGRSLGQKINNAIYFANGFLDYSDFTQIGKNASAFINGSLDEIDTYSLGHTIGMSINKAFDVALGFVNDFKWDLAGTKFADLFNGIVDFINFDNIVDFLQTGFNGVITSINKFFENAKFFELGNKIGEAISRFDLSTAIGNLTRLISNLFISASQFAVGFIQGINWQNLGASLVDSIFSIVGNIDFSGIAKSMWGLFGSAVGAAFGIVTGVIGKLYQKASDALTNLFDQAGEDGGASLLEGILNALSSIDSWITSNILYPFVNGFEKAFKIDAGSSQVMSRDGKKIAYGTLDGILIVWKNIGSWLLSNVISPFIDNWKVGFGIIGDSSTKMQSIGEKVGDGAKIGILSTMGVIPREVEKIVNDIIQKFGMIDLSQTISKVIGSVTNMKDSIGNIFGEIPGKIRGAANDIWYSVEQVINGMIEGFNHFADQISSKFSFTIPNIPGVTGAGQSFGLTIPHIPNLALGRFENGGYPDSASLFYANENGIPEMVGRIGNRTAVANNDQIVEAVADGVAAVLEVYIPQLIQAIREGNDTAIQIDGKTITKVVNKHNRESGVSIFGGSVVNVT